MKKLFLSLSFILVSSLLYAGGSREGTGALPLEEGRMLVAYYSLIDIVPEGADAVSHATPSTGNTESAARIIAELTGGELFAIRTEQSYPVSHSEASAVAGEELRSDFRPVLTTHVENMAEYEIIFLGYPIWWYVEPMAIRTFLEEYDFTGKTIIPFCTSMGAGIQRSILDIEELASGAAVLSGLSLPTGRDSREQIAAYLNEIGITE